MGDLTSYDIMSIESAVSSRPKAYYTKDTAFTETLKEFNQKITTNIASFKEYCLKKNCKPLSRKNLKEAEDAFHNKTTIIPDLEIKRVYDFRLIGDVLCRIEYDIYPMGIFSNRRTTYLISRIDALYFTANGRGLQKYLILKSTFWMFRRNGEKQLMKQRLSTTESLSGNSLDMGVPNPGEDILAPKSKKYDPFANIIQDHRVSMRNKTLRAKKAALTKQLKSNNLLGMGSY